MKHKPQQPPTPPQQPQQPKLPALMESYFFKYTYSNPPAINGIAAPQSYIGLGFAPVGTYKPGQTLPILDKATGLKQIGTYQIGNVNDQVPFNAQQINHLSVAEYDWGPNRYISGTGLVANPAANGLGSENGTLLGLGAFGTNVTFNNQHTAINPIHF